MTILIGAISFGVGVYAGTILRELAFDNLDWKMLRWDNNTLSYRIAPLSYRVRKNEKIFFALAAPTDNIPEEGIIFD